MCLWLVPVVFCQVRWSSLTSFVVTFALAVYCPVASSIPCFGGLSAAEPASLALALVRCTAHGRDTTARVC
jgi:hypothetical protein